VHGVLYTRNQHFHFAIQQHNNDKSKTQHTEKNCVENNGTSATTVQSQYLLSSHYSISPNHSEQHRTDVKTGRNARYSQCQDHPLGTVLSAS